MDDGEDPSRRCRGRRLLTVDRVRARLGDFADRGRGVGRPRKLAAAGTP